MEERAGCSSTVRRVRDEISSVLSAPTSEEKTFFARSTLPKKIRQKYVCVSNFSGGVL